MTKLRYLCMSNVSLEGDFENLFQNLRWLVWEGVELDFMGSNFIPKKLVVLDLLRVNIIEQWMGWSQIKHLRVLKVRRCIELITLPDISALKELEVLNLSYCRNLKIIHPSIRMLSKLQMLVLWDCDQLEGLPNLPNSLTSLEFHAKSSKTLPDFSNLTNLENLEFKHHFERWNATLNFRNLNRMTTLRLECSSVKFDCSDTEYFARGFCTHDYDEMFEIEQGINLQLELPSTLVNLQLKDCYTLQTVPNFSHLQNLKLLSIRSCPVLTKIDGLDGAKSLTSVEIGRCKKLFKLGGMGISVTHLELEDLDSLVSLPNLSTAKKLKELRIMRCKNLVEIQGLDNVEGIESFVMYGCSSLQRIGNLSHMKMLKTLDVLYCDKLLEIRGLGNSLMNLRLEDLDSLVSLSDLSSAKKLKELRIMRCKNLVEIQGLDNAEGIESFVFLP